MRTQNFSAASGSRTIVSTWLMDAPSSFGASSCALDAAIGHNNRHTIETNLLTNRSPYYYEFPGALNVQFRRFEPWPLSLRDAERPNKIAVTPAPELLSPHEKQLEFLREVYRN